MFYCVIILLIGGDNTRYLYFNPQDPKQYQKDQKMLNEWINNSSSEEERSNYERALMTLRLLGEAWVNEPNCKKD